MRLSSSALRRLSLLAWLASLLLILLAAVLLVGFGGAALPASQVDIDVKRPGPGRRVGLGVVAMVAIGGALAFALGAWTRMRADEVDRREAATSFGVRPGRNPGRPGQGAILPPDAQASEQPDAGSAGTDDDDDEPHDREQP